MKLRRTTVTRNRGHHWLLTIPLVWQLGLIPVVNGVTWTPLHLPFGLVWVMSGVLVCTAVLRWVFVLDRKSGVETEEREFLAHTTAEHSSGRGIR